MQKGMKLIQHQILRILAELRGVLSVQAARHLAKQKMRGLNSTEKEC